MLLFWLVVLVFGVVYFVYWCILFVFVFGISVVYLILMGVFSYVFGWLLLVFWLFWLVVVFFFVLFDLCWCVFSGLLFVWFQKVLLLMFDIECEVIEVGIVWWDGELFSGCLDWQKLFDYFKV